VIVAVVEALTAEVATGKAAVVLPAATITEAGTVAAALLLDKATETPPVGAIQFNVTVPVEEVPAVRDMGLSERPDGTTGVMVSVAVGDAPL
jgi:hypothetical protein